MKNLIKNLKCEKRGKNYGEYYQRRKTKWRE